MLPQIRSIFQKRQESSVSRNISKAFLKKYKKFLESGVFYFLSLGLKADQVASQYITSEEYSLIWKAKPLTIQTDKGKWQKNSQKCKN